MVLHRSHSAKKFRRIVLGLPKFAENIAHSVTLPDDPAFKQSTNAAHELEDVKERTFAHSGILSCFFQGFSWTLFFSVRSAFTSRRRVPCGMMTSSI